MVDSWLHYLTRLASPDRFDSRSRRCRIASPDFAMPVLDRP
jgi:hypothetical protein